MARAARHAARAALGVAAALAALGEEPGATRDRRPRAGPAWTRPTVCRALRADPRLGDAWLLAITVAGQGPRADAALDAGADDYLHRPFTRAELLARARAGLRAAQQRSDDALLRALLVNVPGAIYRSAWHAGFAARADQRRDRADLRLSARPNFLASAKRTIVSIVNPDDRERVLGAVADSRDRGLPFAVEYRIVRADGEVRWVLDRGQLVDGPGDRLWLDGALFDITDRRRRRRRCAAGRSRRRARRSCAPRAPASWRPADAAPAQDRARPARRRAAAPGRPRARRPRAAGSVGHDPQVGRAAAATASARS